MTDPIGADLTSDGLVRTTLTDALIERLRADIRAGVIEPGSRLRQSEVADRFNMSTTPVREAFQALEREGLLVSHAHRGVIVFKPTVDDLVETYDIRIPLEALAIKKAVPNMTAADIDELESLIEQMARAIDQSDVYSTLNARYHKALYRPAARPKLIKLIADMREASGAYLHFYAAITPGPEEAHREHVEIFEACKARDPERAAAGIEKHLHHTVDHVATALSDIEQSA